MAQMTMTVNIPATLRVTEALDSHGNEISVLSLHGHPVLYSRGHFTPGETDGGEWEEIFGRWIARRLGEWLIARGAGTVDDRRSWHLESPTGREVRMTD